MNPIDIINKYYNCDTPLRELLLTHSDMVCRKALSCLDRHPELNLDRNFVVEASMLHDIGIIACNAPDIYCHGPLPYICHGVEGRKMLESEGLPQHALVCERHTGAGLSVEDIIRQNLPLEPHDMLPITPEEKLICYADKFYSKSGDPTQEKSLDRVMASMKRHGDDTLARFMQMHRLFD